MATAVSLAAVVVLGIWSDAMVTLAAGAVRDAWLSKQRVAAANYVKKNAKAAAKISDPQRRAAALADLRFMELRA